MVLDLGQFDQSSSLTMHYPYAGARGILGVHLCTNLHSDLKKHRCNHKEMFTAKAMTHLMAISPTEDPLRLFEIWFDDARKGEINDPNAISLATVDRKGMPNVRIVLLKDFDEQGFVFYTNLESAKGAEILTSGAAAMCIHWKSLQRQVRLRGRTELIAKQQADAYFESRPRKSRIGAWASQQSRPMSSRRILFEQVAKFGLKYAFGSIPRPPYWSGVRLRPSSIEFWEAGDNRLHQRIEYRRDADTHPWTTSILYP